MPKRKSKADASVSFNLTLGGPLARRLDREFAKAKKMNPYMFVSRSAFLAFCLGQWVEILDSPSREPTLAGDVRVRTRPPAGDARAQLN